MFDAGHIVDGRNLVEVTFGTNAGNRRGRFRRTGATTWVEFGVANEPRFRYEESNRDDWSVYLVDTSRRVEVQLDVHRRVVAIAEGSKQRADAYTIRTVRALTDEPFLVPALDGHTVNRIEFGHAEGGTGGTFAQTAPHHWVELDASGVELFHFVELRRNGGAVDLFDPVRDARIGIHVRPGRITYSDASTPVTDQYVIRRADSKVNGRTANRVVFRGDGAEPLGEYRQTGEWTWVELDDHQNVVYRFREERRDDWTVSLHDASRSVWIDLDLHRAWVRYRDSRSHTFVDQRRIESASAAVTDVEPRSRGRVRGSNVRCISVGDAHGARVGTYRQVSDSLWAEVGPDGRVRRELDERHRRPDSISLTDPSTGASGTIDLVEWRVAVPGGLDARTVIGASSSVHGYMTSEIEVGASGGPTTSTFRQTGPAAWVELDGSGAVRHHFDEIRREDWSVAIADTGRAIEVEFDLRTMRALLRAGVATPGYFGAILRASAESDLWLHAERISCRPVLAHDYAPSGRDLNPSNVFRTSLRVSPVVRRVDLWANWEVQVTIDGQPQTLRRDVPVTVAPGPTSRLAISVPAVDFHAPTIQVRTDLMAEDDRYLVIPDVELHQKLATLDEGALARGLDVPPSFTDRDVEQVQQAIQNIARARQHTYNRRPFGAHHGRALLPASMHDPHFSLHVKGDGFEYQPLTADQVAGEIAGGRLVESSIGQAGPHGGLGAALLQLGSDLKSGGHVFVHTAERLFADGEQTVRSVARDGGRALGSAGHDLGAGVQAAGEHLVHGDVIGAVGSLVHGGEDALGDLGRGGSQVQNDISRGGASAGDDLAEAARQVIVISARIGDDLQHLIVSDTHGASDTIRMLFGLLGIEPAAVIGLLTDALDWPTILSTQQHLMGLLDGTLDTMASIPAQLEASSDRTFAELVKLIIGDLDALVDRLDVPGVARQSSPAAAFSAAAEKLEWLLDPILRAAHAEESDAAAALGIPEVFTGLGTLLAERFEELLGRDGGQLLGALEAAGFDLEAFLANDPPTPDYLLAAIVEIVKATSILCLDTLNVLVDAVLEVIEAIILWFKDRLHDEWPIPLLHDLFLALTGTKLTLGNLVTLLAAIPISVLTAARFEGDPLAALGIAAGNMTPLDGVEVFRAVVYEVCEIASFVIDPTYDLVLAWDELLPTSMGSEETPQRLGRLTKKPVGVQAWCALLFPSAVGALALAAGTPIAISESIAIPPDSQLHDAFAAPSLVAHHAWVELGIGWVFNVAMSVWGGLPATPTRAVLSVQSGGNFVLGVISAGFMVSINQYDDRKVLAINGAESNATAAGQDGSDALRDALPDDLRNKPAELRNKMVASTALDPSLATKLFQRFTTLQEAAAEPLIANQFGEVAQTQRSAVSFQLSDFTSTGSAGALWMSELLNYRAWAVQGCRTGKAFTNFVDTIPSILKLGLLPPVIAVSDGVSVPAVMALAALADAIEAVGFGARAAGAELL